MSRIAIIHEYLSRHGKTRIDITHHSVGIMKSHHGKLILEYLSELSQQEIDKLYSRVVTIHTSKDKNREKRMSRMQQSVDQ